MKRFAIIIITAGVALIAVPAVLFFLRPGAGDLSPVFSLPAISGEMISSDEFKGKPMLVHFWATWCGFCIDEFPSLDRLAKDKSGAGLEILAFSEDDRKNEQAVKNLVDKIGLRFPVIIDDGGMVADKFGSYGMPETVAVNKDGIIVRRFEGQVNWDSKQVRDFIDSLLE
jgi:thiol-disulfide isomerase/thioredoxin